MRRAILTCLCALVVCIAAGVAIADLVSCASSPGPVTPENLASYGVSLEGCVRQATDRDAAVACMAAVKQSYCGDGGQWADAGPGVCDSGIIEPNGGH